MLLTAGGINSLSMLSKRYFHFRFDTDIRSRINLIYHMIFTINVRAIAFPYSEHKSL